MGHELAIDRMSFGERLAYAFRERQIYIRSEGQVRFITLRPWIQITFVLLILGVFGWVAYASLTVAFKDYVIAAKGRQFANVQTEYEDRITDMLSSMDQINGRLLLNQDSVETQLDNVRGVATALELRQRQIAALMAKQFGVSLSELSPEPVADGPKIVDSETRSIMTIIFEPAQPDVRYSRIPGQQSAIGDSDDEAMSVMRRVGRQLTSLARAQRSMLNLLETQSVTHESELEKAIASLGFEPSDFAPSEKAGAVASLGDALGGPLVRLAAFNPDAPLNSEERQVVRISALADTVNSYVEGLKLLPIRVPLEAIGRVASGFGPRRDPFTGVSAMHQGIDYPQPSGTPVKATAGGEVKRAGWGGAYGRLIEIAHDNGVSTRYGHLSKIEVKVGDRIVAGQQIGLVGSTGRSTGAHLHYETRVNGNAVNPVKFLRVGSYVFK